MLQLYCIIEHSIILQENKYIIYKDQSIGVSPFFNKNSLHLEKCLQPKKPLYADNGLGCADCKIKWLGLFKIFKNLLACPPQSKNTIGLSI